MSSTHARVGRQCAATGLWLVPAGGEVGYRVAKDRYGGLATQERAPGALTDPKAGRFDTPGRTLYVADNKECAYAEVLAGIRQERASLQKDADAAGYTLDEWVQAVTAQAEANNLDAPWAISCAWQMARSIYEIRMPTTGWWVQIDALETLNALTDQYPHAALRATAPLTLADVEGDNRELTITLACYIRELVLDDGAEPLGIQFRSKWAYGHCWAFWDRRADVGLGRGGNDPEQVASWNVGPDPAFLKVAGEFRLPLLPPRR